MAQKRHIMHGRDHLPGGADPVGSGAEIDLGRYVIAAVPLYRNLWVGGHEPTDSGEDAKTTIACPLINTAGAAPLDKKFYDHSTPLEVGSTLAYGGPLGFEFFTLTPDVECTGVQFWRDPVSGSGSTTVYLWDSSDWSLIDSKSDGSGVGWNEIYFDVGNVLLSGSTNKYVVTWASPQILSAGPTGTPIYAGELAQSASSSPWMRQFPVTGGGDPPTIYTTNDYGVGPILNYTPDAGDPIIVATASHGTEPGVFIHRTEKGDNVIDIFWSAADATVAADVMVMGPDPGGTQPCESERYRLLGNCEAE